MTRFRCLGGECEATCCAAFAVPADRETHVRLKVLGQTDALARELVEQAVELTPEGPDYGRLRFAGGRCTMLEPSGLCRIQARFGNEGLFEVCATYPRYFSQVDDAMELFGSLSCPEVARLALLAPDAFETAELAAEQPRKLRNSFRTERPYYRPFRLVRASVLTLLSAQERSSSEKLFALLWLTDKLKPVLHEGCAPVAEADLSGALAALGEPAVLAQLATTFHQLPSDRRLADSVLSQVLGRDASVLAAERASVPAATRAALEPYLTRYAQNYVWTTPYMLFPNLLAYASDLALKLALLRAELEHALQGFTGEQTELERAVVSVVYRFVRQLEHSDLTRRAREALDQQGMSSFAHAVCFL